MFMGIIRGLIRVIMKVSKVLVQFVQEHVYKYYSWVNKGYYVKTQKSCILIYFRRFLYKFAFVLGLFQLIIRCSHFIMLCMDHVINET